MIITRFGHTYDAPDNLIKWLAGARRDGVSIYHGRLVIDDYRIMRRNWRDKNRRAVIGGMRLYAKRVLIGDEIRTRLERAGFKNVRVKI